MAEDDAEQGWKDLEKYQVNKLDTILELRHRAELPMLLLVQ